MLLQSISLFDDQHIKAEQGVCSAMPSFFPTQTFDLPPLNSLLVVGTYHPTAPVHLAISYATENPDACPVVLSPSKAALKDGLKAFADHHVSSTSRRGNMLDVVSRIQML